MTQDELRAWLELRGVHTAADMEHYLAEFEGRTVDELDELYDELHGSMA